MMPDWRKKLIDQYEWDVFHRFGSDWYSYRMPGSQWDKFLAWVYGLKVWLDRDA